MAKTQKYTEDQLLEAVIKFAEVEPKKIKATELAKWCRTNVVGLEEVRDYHFMRNIRVRNPKTGQMVEKPKLCTLKIEEINKARSLTVKVNKNLLLHSSTIETFLEQPEVVKRKYIVETRETVDKLLTQLGNLRRENEVLRSENKAIKSDLLKMTNKIEEFQKAQDILSRQVLYLMEQTEESTRKEMLSQMGIDDGSVNLETYNRNLQNKLSEIMDMNKIIKKYKFDTDEKIAITNEEKTDSLSDIIMSGLDL